MMIGLALLIPALHLYQILLMLTQFLQSLKNLQSTKALRRTALK